MSAVDTDILVVNAGSTSLKLHLVDERERSTALAPTVGDSNAAPQSAAQTAAQTADWGELSTHIADVAAVAHRVVHGGAHLRDPIAIDAEVLEQIFALEALAPLHNAPALRGIELARTALPDVPQVAVFDTGFHRTLPDTSATYALPRRWREQWGVKRYGFHGLSLQWCAERAAAMLESEDLRLVVCHLGGGCSVSGLRGGRSVDTTMGFSPLEGVPMATRSGSLDPGALLYLLRARKLTVHELEQTLNFEAGMRALGGSADMAELEQAAAARNTDAQLAIELFSYRVAGAVAAMAVATSGIDALAFTAGIGEHSPLVRERVCERLRFLGVRLDPTRNRAGAADSDLPGRAGAADDELPDRDVSAVGSAVRVLVIRAREEVVAARAARKLLADHNRLRLFGASSHSPLSQLGTPTPDAKKDRPAGGSGPIRGRE